MDSKSSGQSSNQPVQPIQPASPAGYTGVQQTTPNPAATATNLQMQAAANIMRRKVMASYSNNLPKNSASLGRLKETPSSIDSESWKRYHTAWQDYYQKYYSEYYSNAARNYVQKERLKDARAKAEDEEVTGAAPETNESNIRKTIRKKATASAKKSRRHRRFIPIIAGLSVVFIILFLQYNRLIFAPIMAYVSPGNAPASSIDSVDPTVTRAITPDPRLIIPKLNVDVPVHFGIEPSQAMSYMNDGVAHYRIPGANAFPGEIGNLVITGHSAGDIYSSNPYKYIFSGLERLEAGDTIYVNYKSVRYTYTITKKEVIEPTNVAALVIETDKPLITLVTCTPLGTSRYRLLVFGEQISPSYEDANSIDIPTEVTPTEESLPANSPSFFDGLWGWLTNSN
ncbi:class E sortase [Candidatus Saccharibacteria bacterium]|nr:class E sortase [Candidatus Saccharibacteria bacterium]